MSRVVVLGHCPLPYEDLQRSYGPGTRTWQFAGPLVADGHEVTVVASRIPFVYPDDREPVKRSEENGCVVYRVEQTAFEVGGQAARIIDEVGPDCLVGATAYPSYIAAILAGEIPVWADVFGSLLAEAQAKAAAYGDDSFMEHFVRMSKSILVVADRFSTVSGRQAYELVGQLGIMERLTSGTIGYDFVFPIPCGVEPMEFPAPADPTGGRAGPDGFIVLWSGGFNTWTDVDTLFAGLEAAMERSPGVHFVSTGGTIEGHDELTYPRFEELVSSSRFRDRFHLKGWVRRSEAMSYYGAASVGINLDARHYEVTFGSRNRLLEWALAGLPAISTDLCELTGEMASEGKLFTIPVGDPTALAERILELESDRGKLARVSDGLADMVLERYSFECTVPPLLEWVRDPSHSPDFPDRRAMRVEAREATLAALKPALTPESPLSHKVRHYLKSEGVSSTVRRVAPYLKRRSGGERP
ncbi:MAG: glycosyltransferase [Actinobacteria bacterium]|nr:glycosyltransferase [Actinomycetota bacterium]MBU1942437.1 glycosyltransferase [Actinomycetota bacterium]MBU2686309.1 glycosyltransferase [Actinomycetota bacterium]